MASSPTSRTLGYLKRRGWTPAVVERYNSFSKMKNDLYGFIDILAMREGDPLLGIQATSGANVQARIGKSLAIPALETWLAINCKFQVWGWRMVGKKGKRKLYKVRQINVVLVAEGVFELEEIEG